MRDIEVERRNSSGMNYIKLKKLGCTIFGLDLKPGDAYYKVYFIYCIRSNKRYYHLLHPYPRRYYYTHFNSFSPIIFFVLPSIKTFKYLSKNAKNAPRSWRSIISMSGPYTVTIAERVDRLSQAITNRLHSNSLKQRIRIPTIKLLKTVMAERSSTVLIDCYICILFTGRVGHG